MPYALFCIFCFFLLSAIFSLFIMPGTRGYKNSPLKMRAVGMRESDEGGAAFELAMVKRVLSYRDVLMYI